MSVLKEVAAGGVGAAVAVLAIARPCVAQVRVEVTPFVGLYAPMSSLTDGGEGFNCAATSGSCLFRLTQASGPAVGARITTRVSRQIALDVSLGQSWSHFTSDLVLLGDTQTTITFGSVGLSLNFAPPEIDPVSLYVVGGFGFVTLGGAAYGAKTWPGLGAQTDWGPQVGAGVRMRVAPTLAVRAEVEDHVYSASSTVYPFTTSVQHDLVFSLGLSAVLSGRGGPRP